MGWLSDQPLTCRACLTLRLAEMCLNTLVFPIVTPCPLIGEALDWAVCVLALKRKTPDLLPGIFLVFKGYPRSAVQPSPRYRG